MDVFPGGFLKKEHGPGPKGSSVSSLLDETAEAPSDYSGIPGFSLHLLLLEVSSAAWGDDLEL